MVLESNKNLASSDSTKESEAALAAAKPVSKFVSLGQKAYLWSIYLIIDWFYNAAVGVGFAYWGKYTETGKRVWSGPVTGWFERRLTPFFFKNAKELAPEALELLQKNNKSFQKSVGYGNDFASIITGGMFTIPPLIILERPAVSKFFIRPLDRIIYGKDVVENDPKFEESYKAIDNEPKKGFWSGLFSRFAGLAPLLASVIYPPTRKWLDGKSKDVPFSGYFKGVSGISKKVFTTLGRTPETMFPTRSVEDANARWEYVHNNIAMDFGFGLPYAAMHKFWYNVFSAVGWFFGDKSKNPETASIDAHHKQPVLETKEAQPNTKHADKEHMRSNAPTPRIAHITREQHMTNVAEVSQMTAK